MGNGTVTTTALVPVPATRAWRSLVAPEEVARWAYGVRAISSWAINAPVFWRDENDELIAIGEILDYVEGSRFEATFQAKLNPGEILDRCSRLLVQVFSVDENKCEVTLQNSGLVPNSEAEQRVGAANEFALDSLRRYLEVADPGPA